jgi:hypothetical protein
LNIRHVSLHFVGGAGVGGFYDRDVMVRRHRKSP